MFSSSGACIQCHPDCATCSGANFNQCLSCPSTSPVLTSGQRCVQTCAKSEYFDSSSGTCKSCDSSCASCSGGGSNACLSCAGATDVLRAGVCTGVNCGNGSGPTAGLGVCLAELVETNSGPPVSIPPVEPNTQQPGGSGGGLVWWQILLIVLGILLLLFIILILWRRHARKKRAQETEQFKHNLKRQGLWSKLWRNPFAAWWSRRRSSAVRHSQDPSRTSWWSRRRSTTVNNSQDVERMSDAKDWKSNDSSADRRPITGVPKSISRGSWFTIPRRIDDLPSIDGSSHFSKGRLNAIHEGHHYEGDDRDRSRGPPSTRDNRRYNDGVPSTFNESRHGDSRYYGQEIEQDDARSEQTYDPPSQYPRPDFNVPEDRGDLVSIIKSDYTEGDRYDDRHFDNQRSRTRDNRSHRQDYPASVSSRPPSDPYRLREDQRSYGRSLGAETPSVYSQRTGHPRLLPPAAFDANVPRDAVLSSRFSTSTTAASMHPPSKARRKQVPTEPVPGLKEPARQLTEAEMYKMSKLGPDLLDLVSPMKSQPRPSATKTSPIRNPFLI